MDHKKWMATVTFHTERFGELNVDFAYDKNSELDDLIENSHGRSAVKQILAVPNPLDMPRNETLEALLRRLEIVEDLKSCALHGSQLEMQRLQASPNANASSKENANAQTDPDDGPPTPRRKPGPLPV